MDFRQLCSGLNKNYEAFPEIKVFHTKGNVQLARWERTVQRQRCQLASRKRFTSQSSSCHVWKLFMSESLDWSFPKCTKQDGQPLLQMFAGGWLKLFWSITLSGASPLNCLLWTRQYDELLARTKVLLKDKYQQRQNYCIKINLKDPLTIERTRHHWKSEK